MIAVTSVKWQMSPHQFKKFLYSVHVFHVMSQGKIIITQSVLPFIANKWIGMAMCQCVFGSVQTYFQSNLTSSNLNMEFSGKPRLNLSANQKSFFALSVLLFPNVYSANDLLTRPVLAWFDFVLVLFLL